MRHTFTPLTCLLGVLLFTAGCSSNTMHSNEDLNGVDGKIFKADVDNKQFELLKETVIDPKTDEGRSRHTVYWNDETTFVRVDRQSSFEGLDGEYTAHIRRLADDDAKAAAAGEPFVCLHVTLYEQGAAPNGITLGDDELLVPLTPDTTDARHRAGTVTIDGKPVAMRLRGPRAQVDIRTAANADALRTGFWETKLFGQRDAAGRFVADRIDLLPRTDPRTVDDPNLPRVLVVGDSISMNYHDAVKHALKGIANYYRVDGNAGPSDRGVACMELWLGDYETPGLHWDVIQFNHGLHDLKQFYDEATETYGDYQLSLDEYKANLEKEITIMRRTGATLMWCSTTPVPTSSIGHWNQRTMGRKHGADLIFNRAAMEVLAHHPDILINDLNQSIRDDTSGVFDKWWRGNDVHFWGRPQADVVGGYVAEAIKNALKVHAERKTD